MRSLRIAFIGSQASVVDRSRELPSSPGSHARCDRRYHRDGGADLDRDVAGGMVVHDRAFGFRPGGGHGALSGRVAASLASKAAGSSSRSLTVSRAGRRCQAKRVHNAQNMWLSLLRASRLAAPASGRAQANHFKLIINRLGGAALQGLDSDATRPENTLHYIE